jgi:hypothetical protein
LKNKQMVHETAYICLRQNAPRFALALLFQPEKQKETLSTLLLLGLEFDRIVAQASESLLAIIRLQWWQDQLDADGEAAVSLAAHLRQQLAFGKLTAEEISDIVACWKQSAQLGMSSDSSANWAQLVRLMSVKSGLKRPELAEAIGRSVALSRMNQAVDVPSADEIYAQAGKGSEFLICLAYLTKQARKRDVTRSPFLIFEFLYQVLFRPSSR